MPEPSRHGLGRKFTLKAGPDNMVHREDVSRTAGDKMNQYPH